MLLRGGQRITEKRAVCYWGEDSVVLKRGQCITEQRTVWY